MDTGVKENQQEVKIEPVLHPVLPPPPPPMINLNFPNFKLKEIDPHREQLFKQFGMPDKDPTLELTSKISRSQDQDASSCSETQGTGLPDENLQEDLTGKIQCNICTRWVKDFEIHSHYSGHPSKVFQIMYNGNFNINVKQTDIGLVISWIPSECLKLESNHQIKYFGNHLFLIFKELMERVGIKSVLNVAIENNEPFQDRLHYLKINIFDDEKEDISKNFDQAFKFIQKAKEMGNQTLIHCIMGISRSSTITLGYLISHENLTLKDAWTQVQTARAIAKPNPGFVKQLLQLELKIHGKNSIDGKEIHQLFH